jgi:ATP-dependent 26S proteasome regulatory subunit
MLKYLYICFRFATPLLQACCTEAGMYALRERRVHVTQEDFEMAVAKVIASSLLCLPYRL